jgi:16S rRNA (guanine966-N2)-methyltransferase
VRIVGGTLGGRVLRAPAGASTRPTSEKVREALFQILARKDALDGPVLDLFAGTGALGIEALSRGAPHATFIESGKQAIKTLTQNLADLGVADRSLVLTGDALRVVARPLADRPPFKLVLVDPPYASDLAVKVVTALPPAHLADGVVIVIEHDRRNAPPDALGSLVRTDERRYGDTLISLYETGT